MQPSCARLADAASCRVLLVPMLLAVASGSPAQGPAEREMPVSSAFSQGATIDFVHVNGASGDFHLPEMTGAGAALFDYDNDGDLDVYLVQSGQLPPADPGGDGEDAAAQRPIPNRHRDQLYRNELIPSGTLSFTNTTASSGLRSEGYGMGVAAGDFDNDGWVDLYVTNLGANQLWRNNGDDSFSDWTDRAGVAAVRWSTSAAFSDFNRDGWLDLFVANYVRYDIESARTCFAANSLPDYCGPVNFEAEPDRLFRNRGDGSFEDVSLASGVAKKRGPGLGVVAADFDGDGWIDFYVANDAAHNHLWISRRDGSFSDEALFAGAAVNAAGWPEASMGIAVADFDGDGDEDLFMTHFGGESNTLYRNDGSGNFEDQTARLGLGAPSLRYTAWGTAWLDYDNDGWLDLFVANGATRRFGIMNTGGPDALDFGQPNQLFRSDGGRGYREVGTAAGAATAGSRASRGTAFGDVDNDGDIDVLVSNNNGPARLLLNRSGERNNWLGLRVADPVSKRDLVGARIRVRAPGLPAQWRRVHSDGSYCSAGDPRILFGLGRAERVDELVAVWPDGRTEKFPPPAINHYHVLAPSLPANGKVP